MNKQIFIIISALFTYAYAQTDQSAICTYSNNNKSKNITVSINDKFTIKLPSNPSTGYTWDFVSQPDAHFLTLISDKQYEQKKVPSRLVGQGGTDVWHFKALKAGQTTIDFIYKRPWEQTSEGQKIYSVVVIIEE